MTERRERQRPEAQSATPRSSALLDEATDVLRPGTSSALEAFAATLGVEEAVRERSARYWLEQAARESATLAGVLADLGESGETVQLTLLGGRRLNVTIIGIGADCLVARSDGARHLTLRFSSLAHVGARTRPMATGDRRPGAPFTFADAVIHAAAERPDVVVLGSDGATMLTARLLSSSPEVARCRPEGGGGDVHVSISAIGGLVVDPLTLT